MLEDIRKWSEGDWREQFGDEGWSEALRQLAERSDALESQVHELRSFIQKEERPEVGMPAEEGIQEVAEIPAPPSGENPEEVPPPKRRGSGQDQS